MTGVDFDPDKFEISKRDLQDIVGAIIKYWKKHPIANFHFIAGAELVQGGLLLTPDVVVRKFWNLLLKVIHRIQYENALASALKDGEHWAESLSKIKKKIAEEGIEALLDD